MEIIKKQFGEQLKLYRKLKTFTQEQLAEKIGINLRQLARIEAGESFVSAETLFNICKTLEISPSVLFDFNIETEVLLTGSGKDLHFNIIKNGNIVKLFPKTEMETQENNPEFKNFDLKMQTMAHKLNKKIYVSEIVDGIPTTDKIYKPDGQIDITTKNSKYDCYNKLVNNINKIANDKMKVDFMNLAYESLRSVDALNKLKLMIKGIELTLQ